MNRIQKFLFGHLLSNRVQGFSLWYIPSIDCTVFILFYAIWTIIQFTKFTPFAINVGRHSSIYFLVCDVVKFPKINYNIVVYCFEILYMVLFTLAKQLTWTGYAVIFCVPQTLGALIHYILDVCRFHNANGLSLKHTSYENTKKNVSKNMRPYLWRRWYICYSKSRIRLIIQNGCYEYV